MKSSLRIFYGHYHDLITVEECEDTKVVIRIRNSKKDRQDNSQMEKVQKDKQRSTKERHKTKDQVTRTPLNPTKTRGELVCSARVGSYSSTSGIRHSDNNFCIFTLFYQLRKNDERWYWHNNLVQL
jgi:hypothetical protein